MGALALSLLLAPGAARAQSSTPVYGDDLSSDWENWSWAKVGLSDASRVHGGSRAIRVEAGANQALYLHHDATDASRYQSLTFWINGGVGASNGGQQLQVQATLGGQAQKAVALPALQAEAWQKVTVKLADLGVAGASNWDGFWIQDRSGQASPAFWVDDIALEGVAAPSSLQLQVDAGQVLRTIDGRIFGLNMAVWDSNLSGSATASILSSLGTTVLRFPGGSMANVYDWSTGRSLQNGDSTRWAANFSTFARVAQAQGVQGYICVNYGSGTPEQAAAWVAYSNASASSTYSLGVDSRGRDWKTAGFWAGLRGAAPLAADDGYNFLRASHPAPYGFRYWEIGNENYGSWEYDLHGEAGSGLSGQKYDAATYASYFQQFSAKMKAVDGAIRIGAVVAQDRAPGAGWTRGVLSRLKAAGVTPNFVAYHHYPQEPGHESDAFLLQAGAGMAQEAATIRGLVNESLGAAVGSGVELTMTELNSVTFSPGKQSTSLVNGLFLADSLAYLARTEFNAVTWWALRNGVANGNNSGSLYGWRQFGDYGLVASGDRGDTPANTPYPSFYGAKILASWGRGGDQVLAASSNYSLLTAHAARLANGRLALLVINKDPSQNLSAQINLAGFAPSSATASVVQYGKPNDTAKADLSTSTFIGVAPSFSYTFPPYSMTVLTLAGSAPNNPNPNPTATPTPVPTPTATPVPQPTATPTPVPQPTATPVPNPGTGPAVTYKITSQWSGGFNTDVTIQNNGPAISGWSLAWKFTGDQKIVNSWNGASAQSGQNVSVKNAAWNAAIPSGGTVSFGFQATWSGANAKPAAFTLNGVPCVVK